MIYARDIDRTLIFSERFIEEFGIDKSNLALIDECKTNSYMSSEVANKLSHLTNGFYNRKIRFIPVTTRSVQQFKRIQFSNLGINIEYAITTNGGKILYHGRELNAWEEYITHLIPSKYEFDSVVKEINSIPGIDYTTKLIDDRYIFSKSNIDLESITVVKSELDKLSKTYQQFEFKMYKNKVYSVPKCFGKDIALNWLKHYLCEDKIISSGDSSFDIPMISISDIKVIPSHSSIGDEELDGLDIIVVNGGINSAVNTMNIALLNII